MVYTLLSSIEKSVYVGYRVYGIGYTVYDTSMYIMYTVYGIQLEVLIKI